MIRFVGHMEKYQWNIYSYPKQFLLQKKMNEILLWLQTQKSFAEFSKHEVCE